MEKSCCHGHDHALSTIAPAPPAAGARYTCPMHPEVLRDRPGDCPKCGMALVAVAGSGKSDDTELHDLKRRLWIAAALSPPPLFFSIVPGLGADQLFLTFPRAPGLIAIA